MDNHIVQPIIFISLLEKQSENAVKHEQNARRTYGCSHEEARFTSRPSNI